MSIKNSLLAILFVIGVAWLLPPQAVADPDPNPAAPCDDKCRQRQYFYNTSGLTYWKYETATCELCGAGCLCVADSADKNIGATCTTMAGQENGNKRWEVKSKTKCDFTVQSNIEAEPANPNDEKIYTKQAIKYCPGP